jgi:acyl-homoserine lactone synthase
MRIHVVNAKNSGNYATELVEHFRIRHEIYVGERRWMKLARPDGLERDQFDNADTTYLLALDETKVVGGTRLVPSVKPHLLSDVFPGLAMKGVPRAPDIYEWTRVHVVKARREGRNRGAALGSLFCGILEFCLKEEISALTALVEMWWLPHFNEMGWPVEPLGIPELIENEWSIAIVLPIRAKALASTRAMFGIRGPVLFDTTSPAEPLRIPA